MGFRFYNQMGVLGLRFTLGIKVWDLFLRFRFWDLFLVFMFGIRVCASCLGSGLDTGLGLRFEVQVWIQVRE